MPMMKETMLKRLLLPIAAAGGGGSAPVQDTATGNPLTFITDLAKPLKSLLIPFTPQQSGTGDPSPSNIRSILPWNGLKVQQTGKNLFDKTNGTEGFVWWEGQHVVGYNDYLASNKIPVVPGAKYTLKKDVTGQNQCELFDINGNYVSQSTNMMGLSVSTFTVPDGVYFIAFNIYKTALDTAQLEVGQTATAYEPYHPITDTDIVFPSAVYGGTLDVVSGVLTVEWAKDTLTGEKVIAYGTTGNTGAHYVGIDLENVSDNQISNAYCDKYKPVSPVPSASYTACRLASNGTKVYLYDPSFTDEATAKSILNNSPVEFVYKLATPQEIQLTPQQITAIVGDNTIWSDADGEMTATYLKKA